MRDDFEFNVQFCEEIEKYASLYDFNRSDYCNRSVQDKTWQTIARKLNVTVNDCKERWKNIRGRYSKYNKKKAQPSGSGVKQIKEYYLAPYLQFLNNFLKSRPSKRNIIEKQTANCKEEPNDEEDDHAVSDDDDEHDPLSEEDLPQSPLPATSLSPDVVPPRKPSPPAVSGCYRKKRTRTLRDVNETACNYFEENRKCLCNKNVAEAPDPDMAFLQSVLPDMKAMNDHQKRKFKMGILNLAEQILEQSVSNHSTGSGF